MLITKKAKRLFKKKPVEYAPVKDGKKSSKKRFFRKKQNQPVKITSDNYPEETSTVAVSQISGPPSPPRRHPNDPIDMDISTSLMNTTLNSTFEEDSDEEQEFAFTSAYEMRNREPSYSLLKTLSLVEHDAGPPPYNIARKTTLSPDITNQRNSAVPDAKTLPPKSSSGTRIKQRKSEPIDLDTCAEWEDDPWKSFVQDRKDLINWDTNKEPIGWNYNAFEDEGELPPLTTLYSNDFIPRDTSDEASLDPSTSSFPVRILSSDAEVEQEIVFVSDPECPLQFLSSTGESDEEDEYIQDTPGYPWGEDHDEKSSPRTVLDMFDTVCTGKSSHHAEKPRGIKSSHLAKKLHQDTVFLIGSMSERLVQLDAQARARFQTGMWSSDQDVKEENNSVVTSGSEETVKKTNLSLCSSFDDDFNYTPAGFSCQFFDPFLRTGQAEI